MSSRRTKFTPIWKKAIKSKTPHEARQWAVRLPESQSQVAYINGGPDSTSDNSESISFFLPDREPIFSVAIIEQINESGQTDHIPNQLVSSGGIGAGRVEAFSPEFCEKVRKILNIPAPTPLPMKELSAPPDNTIRQMLEKLQYLRERPLPEGDLATPSRAALGALEDIVNLLPEGSVTRKPSIGSDGVGGAQIIWRSKKTHLLVSASAGGGEIVPDVYMFFRKDGVRHSTLRFETSKEYADSILAHLPLFQS